MPSYKVILKDEAKTELRITADDVDLECCDLEHIDSSTFCISQARKQ